MSTNKQALREAAEKVTALNLDSAQEVRKHDDEYIECPTCCGDGHVEVETDYCNIDGAALGVLFYGIGEHHGRVEQYFRAANPTTVLALLDELEAKDAIVGRLTAERDALRESEMGGGKYSNTRAAADIYFQLVEECEIPPGGSLVEYVDSMRDALDAAGITVKGDSE